MIWCLISAGRIISWNAKDIISTLQLCTRTISRKFSSRTTEELPVPRELNIWISGIFYHRPNQERWPSYWILSHRQYGRGFFYQTSSRQEISPVQKSNYESTGLKYTLTKGVCWESTYFILHKLSNVWIPVTINYYLISYTQRDYLYFNIYYFGVTIWHPFTIWHLFTNWHIFTIAIDILICLLAKTWELLTIIIQSISYI